jgi:hypothetical protein
MVVARANKGTLSDTFSLGTVGPDSRSATGTSGCYPFASADAAGTDHRSAYRE